MKGEMNERIHVLPVILCLLLLLEITACGAEKNEGPAPAPSSAPAASLAVGQGGRFSDVPEGAWYAGAVEYCRRNGIMNGVSDTAFACSFLMCPKANGTARRSAGLPARSWWAVTVMAASEPTPPSPRSI